MFFFFLATVASIPAGRDGTAEREGKVLKVKGSTCTKAGSQNQSRYIVGRGQHSGWLAHRWEKGKKRMLINEAE